MTSIMKKVEKTDNNSFLITSEKLFLISFSIWLSMMFLSNLTLYNTMLPTMLTTSIRIFCVLLILVKEIWDFRFDLTNMISYVLLFLMIYIGFINEYTQFWDIGFMLIGAKNCDFKKIVKIHVIIICSLSLFVIMSSFFNILEDRIFFQNGRVRHSFGFGYTTFLGHILFFLILEFIYIYKKKFTVRLFLLFFSLNFCVFWFTNTRNPFILTTVSLVFFVFYYNSSYWFKLANKLSWVTIPTFIVSSYMSYLVSNNYERFSMTIKLNDLLSNRLALGNSAIKTYGIKAFGQQIKLLGSSYFEYGKHSVFDQYNYVDSGYIQILIMYGFIFFIVLVVLFSISMLIIYRRKQMSLLFILFIISVHAMIDPQIIMIWYSPFILIIGSYVFSKKKIQPRGENEQIRHSNRYL